MLYRNFQSIGSHGGETVDEFSGEEAKSNLQDWILIVKHVVARDSGSYECQVTVASFLYKRTNLVLICFKLLRYLSYMVLLLVSNNSIGHYRYR